MSERHNIIKDESKSLTRQVKFNKKRFKCIPGGGGQQKKLSLV